jgi:hypothetical protein
MSCVDQLAQPEPECSSDFNPTILFHALRDGIGSLVAKKGWFGAWGLLAVVFCLSAPLSAQTTGTSGNFTYSDNGIYITITDYPTDAVGDVAIPATINGKPVTKIGDNAFSFCTGLTSVSIPTSVTSIENFAFSNCAELTSISIPASVTSIGYGAFSGCAGLVSFSVDAANPNYSSSDGVFFNKLQTSLIQYPGGKSGPYTIPSSVTTIGSNAFSGCTGLTSVEIPAGVTSIVSYAFNGCTGLVAFSVDAANPNYSSLDGVLFDQLQTSLIKYPAGKSGAYTIPSSVTTIEYGAFSGCARLTSISIPSSVTTIGVQAFSDCTGLASVSIPSSITTISERAFSGCIALTSVPIPSSVTTIEVQAFYRCAGLTNVAIPSSVTTIGEASFSGCTGLTSVSIPSSVTTIGGNTFSDCTGLTGVSIPSSVTTIGNFAFSGCTGLTNVSIPSGVTTIESYAFSDCTGLTSVAIPSSVTTIESYAFSDCTSLTSVSIPSGVTSIGSSAFSGCTALVSFSVDAANPNYSSLDGVLFNKLQTSLIQCPAGKSGAYAIPSSVTNIGSYAFYGCTGLTDVSIPSGVTTIGSYAFYGCTGLTDVSIPSGVLTLGDNAFYSCTGLTGISIPSSVTTIGSNAFYGCTALVSFSLDAANPNYSSLGGVLFNKLQTSLIQYPGSKSGPYTIPSGVTTIGSNAFSQCTGLTSVSIPSSVTSIDDSPFFGCTGLVSISVDAANPNYSSLGGVLFNKLQTSLIRYPAGMSGVYTAPSSVTSISDSAFYGCIGLTSVSIPSSVTTIESYAFFGCTGLTSVSIPSGVSNIGSLAFFGCNGLTNVAIPSSVTNIGFSAFANCASLVSVSVDAANPNYSSLDGVLFNKPQTLLIACPAGKSGAYTIPSGVSRIADRAFSECTKLTSVSIPSGVSLIGGGAFSGCTGLTSVSIPSSVTTIEYYAFYGCLNLTRAIFTGNAPAVDYFVFAQTANGFTLYYLSGSSGFTSPTWHGYPTALLSAPTTGISDDFTYSDDGTSITITDYPTDAVGAVEIPSTINGKPVTSIGDYAFSGCYGLTSVSIPSSVTSIGSYAFYFCTELTSVSIPSSVTSIANGAFSVCVGLVSFSVDAANPNYSSLGGVLFNKLQTSLIQYPGGKSGAYTIPSSVTSIADEAISSCINLTSVLIPSSVTSIGSYGLYGCPELKRAIFKGDAPTLGSDAFTQSANGLTIYYINGSLGFSSPTWEGYPAFPMEQPQLTGSPPTTTGTLGVSYYYSCTATGVPPPAFSVTSGTLPDGLSISSTGVISGTPTVAGTFSGTITATNEAAPDATQAFTITINTALQTWRQTYFGTTANTGTAADSAVSNLDGLPNLIEYALGGTPTVANSAIPPKLGTVTIDDETYLTLTFTPQRSDITYTIEVSGDLTGDWTSIPLSGLLTMGQTYTHTDTIAVATGAPRFIRLSVSGQ